MSTEQGDKLIAIFMGVYSSTFWAGGEEVVRWGFKDTHITERWHESKFITETPYHSDWSWLIPVVEKIEENHKTVIAVSDWGDKHYMNIMTGVGLIKSTMDNPSKFMGTGQTKIEAVYNAVTQFIEWLNKEPNAHGSVANAAE